MEIQPGSLPQGRFSLVMPARLLIDARDSHSSAILARCARIVASTNGCSRADLAAATGLGRSTIADRVQELVDLGIVGERVVPTSGRGRPAMELYVRPRSGAVLVADIGAVQARLAVADLSQTLLVERAYPVDLVSGPAETLEAIATRFREMLAEAGLDLSFVRSVVVGLPAPVDFDRGIAVRPPLMPGWDGFPVAAFLLERFEARTLVDNDVNLLALAEARTRPVSELPLVFVKVSTGIGCGIVTSDGRLHRGADGAAGDIGHVRSATARPIVCRCGNSGCLEAIASASAIAKALGEVEGRPDAIDAEMLMTRVVAGDATAVRLLREAALAIGEVVAMLVHFYNPASVVLGGRLARMGDDLLAGVRSVVYRRALPLATRTLAIVNTRQGERGGLIGGVVLGVEEALSPAGLASASDGATRNV